MTGDLYLDLTPVSIISLAALDAGLKDPLRQTGRQTLLDVYGLSGVIGAAKATVTYSNGADTIDLDADFAAVNGLGWRLDAVATDAEWSAIPFEDAGATTYYIGARAADVPASVSGNTTDGSIYYNGTAEKIGVPGVPDTVTDQGGSILMVIDTLVDPGWTAAATRKVQVWLVDPETSADAVAIQTVTAAYNGVSGSVEITIPNNLGQTTVSTTASDYSLFLLGPKITDSDFSANANYVMIGTQVGNGGAGSNAIQTLFPGLGAFLISFGVEHNAGTGVHEVVTAQRLTVTGLAGDKLRATSVSALDDAAQAQVAVVSSTAVEAAGLWCTPSGAKVQTQALTTTDANTNGQVRVKNAAGLGMVELWADEGGGLTFPSSASGTGPAIKTIAAVDTTLTLTHPTAAKYCRLVTDGEIEWNSAKSAGSWRLLVDNASNQVLTVENVGAGLAGLIVKGTGQFENKMTLDAGILELDGINPKIEFVDSGGRDVTRQIPLYYDIDVISGTLARTILGTPPNVYSSLSGTPLVLHAGLNRWLPFGNGIGTGATGASIDEWGFWYNRVAVTGSIIVTLYRVAADGSAARVLMKTLVGTGTAGTWVSITDATGYALSSDFHYYVEVEIDPNGGTNTDYRVLGMWVKWGTTHMVGAP